MIVYGIEIVSDVIFPFDFPTDAPRLYRIEFSSEVPEEVKASLSCGIPWGMAHGRNVYLMSSRLPKVNEPGQTWCYKIKDIGSFYWLSGGKTVWYEVDRRQELPTLCFWFIHIVLPLYLSVEGMYSFLHTGAVEVEGRPVLFIAPSYGGKSTFTDYCLRRGHSLITDDKAATFLEDGKFMVVGSHPYHRAYRKFEDLGKKVDHFMDGWKPIHSFYELQKTEADGEIVIDEVRGIGKFEMLLPGAIFSFAFLKVHRLTYLTRLLSEVNVFRITVPWDMDRLPEVYEAMTVHQRGT